jgi:hypothetical protein
LFFILFDLTHCDFMLLLVSDVINKHYYLNIIFF